MIWELYECSVVIEATLVISPPRSLRYRYFCFDIQRLNCTDGFSFSRRTRSKRGGRKEKNSKRTLVKIPPPQSLRNRCGRREKKITCSDRGFIPPCNCYATVIFDSIYRGRIVRMGFHSRDGRGVNAADAEKKNGNCTLVKIPPPRSLRNRCGRREKKMIVLSSVLFHLLITAIPLFLI